MRNKPARRHLLGITMLEVIISIALIATVLLITMRASTSVLQMQQEEQEALVAARLIDAYATEITTRDFQDSANPIFGLEPGEFAANRSTMDDVDDFHGQTFTTPVYRDDQAILQRSGWTVSFAVDPADQDGNIVAVGQHANAPLRRVQVTCTSPTSRTFGESIWISNVPTNITEMDSFQRTRTATLNYADGAVRSYVPMRNRPETNPWE